MITGYSDTFGRTVANGLGSASSGQTYTLSGTATQFSVAPNTASIAISAAGNPMGLADLQSSNVDITGQVALGAIPATNLATVGFAAKASSAANLYAGSMMVATGGAVSLRFSKIVASGLVTLSTTAVTGLTYVANTVYNLRYQIYWSRLLQVNVMSLKLWAVGAAQPGGWMATLATDAAFTDYTSGTQVGLYARDESTVLGTITAKFQNVAAMSYNLPVPAGADPMCADPAFTYPKQTALQSLASAADTAMASLDPLTSLAGLFPRVRVSNTSVVQVNQFAFAATFGSTEFNVGTPTNLGYNNTSIYLPVGIWLVAFEVQLSSPSANSLFLGITGGPSLDRLDAYMRPWPSQSGDRGVSGTGHISALTYSTDPTTPVQVGIEIFPTNTATTITIQYMALSAIKISDYFV
jgi:hypothetical protein